MPKDWVKISMDKGWTPDLIEFGVPDGGLIECKNRLPFDDRYRKMSDKQDYSETGIGATAQTGGSGLDDCTISGTYTGTTQVVYKVEIDAAAVPDTFEWFKDGVSQASGVAITGAAQALDLGVTVTFLATTGHTAGDDWSATAYAGVTSDTPSQAVQYQATDGSYYLFVGTATKLHRMGAVKYFEDVTNAGGNYSTGTNRWDFLQWGDYVIATNYVDDVQVMTDFTSDSAFVDLSTIDETPPKGKYLLYHKGHIIIANIVSGGSTLPKSIAWSGLEDPSKWTASLTNGAGSQAFPDSGDITGLATVGDSFAVLHKNSISVGRYSGAPYTFSFEHNRVKNIGCEYPGSVISVGDVVFFWGNDDIYSFDGYSAQPVGFGVKETVLPNINATYSYRITAFHDEDNGIVFWAWPNSESADGGYTRILCYNYRVKRFTWLDVTGECIFGFRKAGALSGAEFEAATNIYTEYVEGVTPDGAVILEGYADSSEWQAGGYIFSDIDTDNVLNTYDNSFLAGLITTGEFKADDAVIMVDRVRVRANAYVTNPIVRVGSRMEENDGVSYTAPTTVGSNGYADLRNSGRYNRVEMTLGDDAGIFDAEIHVVSRGLR